MVLISTAAEVIAVSSSSSSTTTSLTTTSSSSYLRKLTSSYNYNNENSQDENSQNENENENTNNSNKYKGNGPFSMDGMETLYDDFSLAWRFLGFYVDCNICVQDDGNNDNDNQDDEEYSSPASECIENGIDTVCRRYALWAAYVDEGYEGNGMNEYQHYNIKSKKYDTSSCSSSSNSRCVKMDCHESNNNNANANSNNFKLLGLYKDLQVDTFVKNIINYQGNCIWNDNDYNFMKNTVNNNNNNNGNNNNDDDSSSTSTVYWPPTKCTAYRVDDNDEDDNDDGSSSFYVYYNAIPMKNGNLGVGLFEDNLCTVPYNNNDNDDDDNKDDDVTTTTAITVEDIFTASSSSSSSSSSQSFTEQLQTWNSAMDAFKVCQPCIAYDTRILPNNSGTDDDNDDDDDTFTCRNNLNSDEPINQCQLFVEESDTMEIATYRDILRKYFIVILLLFLFWDKSLSLY